ncbi:hypothetical protein JK217_02205 [Gluconobacter kondonii]|uniref:hypothetical protein n=1 Tax=Gluconobacter kondonii TaxID=941463 RepID=UPI001B8C5917|nr:hypothetical protein [Gluconobacter kondonii]MBS1076569.1 hypothetical protein [Gluconobacter kondonii]
MTFEEAEEYYRERIAEVAVMNPSPWSFMCAACCIEFLAKLAGMKGGKGYIRYINEYMPESYKSFTYNNGKKDLPEQIYEILRCGLLHSFNVLPTLRNNEGRSKSVLISHSGENLKLIDGFNINGGSALLVFDNFINDIRNSQKKLFSSTEIKAKIENEIRLNPPIQEIYYQKYSVNPRLLGGTSLENLNNFPNITAESVSASG